MTENITKNHKAYRDYEILEKLEAGIELKGSEVKSLRMGKINLDDSFARIDGGQMILYNMHISPYAEASYLNVEPARQRRLLIHKRELLAWADKTSRRGLTIIPTRAYFNARGFAKLELGLCKGKKLHDRRDDIKKRETDRELKRALKSRRR
ncbi:MAG: SsrA-binding protein SmpB [Candidatus Omnitrophota bacterium]|jgi:SsrA-binding protein